MAQPVQYTNCGSCGAGKSCWCCDGNTCNCEPDQGASGCSVIGDGDAGEEEFCVDNGISDPTVVESACATELGIPISSTFGMLVLGTLSLFCFFKISVGSE